MDVVSHALTSIAVGRAGLTKVTRMATPILLVAGTVADVDWFTRFSGPQAFMRGYRTGTHSLLGAAIITVVVALIFVWIGRGDTQFAVGLLPALLIAALGAGMHVAFDLLSGHGLMLLWPFQKRWFGLDLTSEVDGWIIFFLVAGLLTPELFRLVLEEIGSKPKRHSRQRGAIAGLAMVLLFVGARAFAHERALKILDSYEYRARSPVRLAAFPHSATLFQWSGVAETDNALVNVEVPLIPGGLFDPYDADVHFKPESSLALENAIDSPLGREFLKYARFPLANIEPDGDGYQVRITDMRYFTEHPGLGSLRAIIILNAQSLVVNERLEFDSPMRIGVFGTASRP